MAGVQIDGPVMMGKLLGIMDRAIEIGDRDTEFDIDELIRIEVRQLWVEVATELNGKGRMVRHLRETSTNVIASSYKCGVAMGKILQKMRTNAAEGMGLQEAYDDATAEEEGE